MIRQNHPHDSRKTHFTRFQLHDHHERIIVAPGWLAGSFILGERRTVSVGSAGAKFTLDATDFRNVALRNVSERVALGD
jgi:hypothetical protein